MPTKIKYPLDHILMVPILTKNQLYAQAAQRAQLFPLNQTQKSPPEHHGHRERNLTAAVPAIDAVPLLGSRLTVPLPLTSISGLPRTSQGLEQDHQEPATLSINLRIRQTLRRRVVDVIDLRHRQLLVLALLPQPLARHHDRHRTLSHQVVGKRAKNDTA